MFTISPLRHSTRRTTNPDVNATSAPTAARPQRGWKRNLLRTVLLLSVPLAVSLSAISPAGAAVTPVSGPFPVYCQSVTTTSGGTSWQQQLAGNYGTSKVYSYAQAVQPSAVANYTGTYSVAWIGTLYEWDTNHWASTNETTVQWATTSYVSDQRLIITGWSQGRPTFNAAAGYQYAVFGTTVWENSARSIITYHQDWSGVSNVC